MSLQSMGFGREHVALLFQRMEVYQGIDWVGLCSMLLESDQEKETYRWLGLAPGMSEYKGQRMAQGARDYSQEITNKEFEASLKYKSKVIRRMKSKALEILIDGMARRAVGHIAKLLGTLVLAGESTTCYDGQYFFSASHTEGKSGTQKNLLTDTTIAKLSVVLETSPTAAEFVNAVLGVVAHMLSIKDDQGEYMNPDAREFLITVGPLLMGPAAAALSNPVINTGSGAITNTLTNLGGFKFGLAVNPQLSSWTKSFTVTRTDTMAKPLIVQEEVKTQVIVLGPGSEYEKEKKSQLFGVDWDGNVGPGFWQYMAKATFDTT